MAAILVDGWLAAGDILLRRSGRGRNFSRIIEVDKENSRVLLDDTVSVGRVWKTSRELLQEQAQKVDIMYLIRELNCLPLPADATKR